MNEVLQRFYEKKKVLVTGGASFIGSHLVELLCGAGADVTVVDDLSSGQLANLSAVADRISFYRGDLRNRDLTDALCQNQEIVFHLAASHGGRGYIETHPVECMNNMLLDHVVFDGAARAKVKKIVFASSACVYPTTLQASTSERQLLSENDATFDRPDGTFADGEYGWAKLMGEMQLRAFNKQYGIDGVACRIFTAYGERENESHAVIALIAKAAARLDPFPIWGNGEQTRNFTYVGDTVMGMALAGARLSGFETINVGTEVHHTILELADEIFGVAGWKPAKIEKQLDKPVGVKSRAADVKKSQELLNWKPQFSLRDGVAATVDWYFSLHGTKIALGDLERQLMERN